MLDYFVIVAFLPLKPNHKLGQETDPTSITVCNEIGHNVLIRDIVIAPDLSYDYAAKKSLMKSVYQNCIPGENHKHCSPDVNCLLLHANSELCEKPGT